MRSKNFQAYLDNINRVGLAELIDDHSLRMRTNKFRASLIANPLSGRPYGRHILQITESVSFNAA